MGFRSRSESARSETGQARPNRNARAPQPGANEKRHDSRGRHAGGSTREKGYQQRRPEHRQAKSRTRGSGDRVRDLVFSVLRDVTEHDSFANIVLPRALREARITGRDAAFATELTYGCLRATGLLDAVIEKAAGRPVQKIDSVPLDALRLGTYQILRTRVDNHAAVDTSVELVKANGAGGASGFTNGVLRTITRSTPEQWMDRIADGNQLSDIALRHAHPAWIAEAFNDSLRAYEAPGEQTPGASHSAELSPELEAALEADDQRPVVHLAARPGQISGEELALIVGGDQGRWSPYAVYLPEGAPADLEPVRDGLASVQDEGSQLIALALLRADVPEDRGRWLDMCAGPGGKTAFLGSWAMGDDALVDAVEIADHRAQLISNTTTNLPVKVHVGDGRKLESIEGLNAPDNGFDRILVDAPCSGLGALRRRPEARWRKSPEDVPELVALQRELLRSALRACAPGGVVVYSTCSPHRAETVDVVRSVAQEMGATIEDATALVPEVEKLNSAPFVQLWPHRHGTDAMFIAALRPAL